MHLDYGLAIKEKPQHSRSGGNIDGNIRGDLPRLGITATNQRQDETVGESSQSGINQPTKRAGAQFKRDCIIGKRFNAIRSTKEESERKKF